MGKKPRKPKTADQTKVEERERELDEALEATFPASDPVADLEPSAGRE